MLARSIDDGAGKEADSIGGNATKTSGNARVMVITDLPQL